MLHEIDHYTTELNIDKDDKYRIIFPFCFDMNQRGRYASTLVKCTVLISMWVLLMRSSCWTCFVSNVLHSVSNGIKKIKVWKHLKEDFYNLHACSHLGHFTDFTQAISANIINNKMLLDLIMIIYYMTLWTQSAAIIDDNLQSFSWLQGFSAFFFQ